MLNQTERKDLKEIEGRYYMLPVLAAIEESIAKRGLKETLSYLHSIITGARENVKAIIHQRKLNGEIRDEAQTRKTVVGAVFSNAIIYIFLKAKAEGLVRGNIFITSKASRFRDLVAIHVGEETQKPDLDLVIYSSHDDGQTSDDIIIISLKTSLRERAGQTYKWKLLLEIATTDNPIKDKYGISYTQSYMPKVCFATINFYDEINSPQHRGMFKFFDKAFIGKPLNESFISNLSELIDFANASLKADSDKFRGLN